MTPERARQMSKTELLAAQVIVHMGSAKIICRYHLSQPVFHRVLGMLNEQWLAMPQGPIFRRPRRRRATLATSGSRHEQR